MQRDFHITVSLMTNKCVCNVITTALIVTHRWLPLLISTSPPPCVCTLLFTSVQCEFLKLPCYALAALAGQSRHMHTIRHCVHKVQGGPKNWHIFARLITSSNTDTNFHTVFTVRIGRTFVIIVSLKIPPHLKCVATLPCEISMS